MNVYHERITELFDEYYAAPKDDKPTPNKRIEAADELIEAYIGKHGKRPPKSILSRLATYILLDTLTDSHPDKMSREEYPIMSYGQTGRYFGRNITKSEIEHNTKLERGRTKRPFTTDDGAVWVADGILLEKQVKEFDELDWRMFLREILSEREANVIEKYYGEGATHSEIAEELGVSRQRVGVIISQALDKIGKEIKENVLHFL